MWTRRRRSGEEEENVMVVLSVSLLTQDKEFRVTVWLGFVSLFTDDAFPGP